MQKKVLIFAKISTIFQCLPWKIHHQWGHHHHQVGDGHGRGGDGHGRGGDDDGNLLGDDGDLLGDGGDLLDDGFLKASIKKYLFLQK